MEGKVYSFRDDDGNLVNYTVKEHVLVNKQDYVVMCPQNDSSHMEVYKFTDDSLELVESQNELSKVKSASHIM